MEHKEIRKYIIIEYSKYPDDINFKSSQLDAVERHDNNISTATKYQSIVLFENSDKDVYNEDVENIKKDGK